MTAVLLAALLIRLPTPDGYAHYFAPELTRDLAAERTLDAGDLPLIGPPQFLDQRFHFGAAWYYLMYPLAKLAGFRPWSLALTSAVFSMAALILGWFLCRRWFRSREIADLYGLIAAFSALEMQFGKYASNPNLVPFFTLLFFWALEPFLRRAAGYRHAALLGLAWAIAVQLHPVAAAGLTAVLGVILLVKRWRPDRRSCLVTVAVFLALCSPYIYYELTHSFTNIQGLFGLSTEPREFGDLGSRFLETASFWFSLYFNTHHMFGLPYLVGWKAVAAMYATLAAAGLAWWHDRRRPSPPAGEPLKIDGGIAFLLALWLLGPTLLLLPPFGRINQLPIYYFPVLLPLGHILMALGVNALRTRGFRTLAVFLLVSYLGWQIYQIGLYHWLYPSLVTGAM